MKNYLLAMKTLIGQLQGHLNKSIWMQLAGPHKISPIFSKDE